MAKLPAHKAFDVPPDMILELATGLEDPLLVARRHGFTDGEWESLAKFQPLIDAVEKQKAEFQKDGYTARLKFKLMAEMLGEKLFVRSSTDDVTVGQLQETVKLFAKLGDLEPKGNVNVASGPAFSIQINLPAVASADPSKVIEAQSTILSFPSFDKQPETQGDSE